MNEQDESLVARVIRSLNRSGFVDVRAEDLGHGVIKLDPSCIGHSDRQLAVAITRTVPGVTDVVFR